jgi:hypothetical protein
MDSNTGGILGVFGFLVSFAGIIYTAINHKRIRCRCCGRDMDMSVDVEPTEEKPAEVKPVEEVQEEEEEQIAKPPPRLPPIPVKKKNSNSSIAPEFEPPPPPPPIERKKNRPASIPPPPNDDMV